MENLKTELVFVLDRSGSMGGLESDTIGGFNSFVEKQKQEAGEVTITTLLFDHQIEILHDRLAIQAIAPLTEKEYNVRGSTALLDAVGYGIEKISTVQSMSSDAFKAKKVIFVITTDGMENASRKYNTRDIKRLIEMHKKEDQWEFIFLGANIDAIGTAAQYGIDEDHAVQFRNNSEGIHINYGSLGKMVSDAKKGKAFDKSWKKDIEEDFEKGMK